MSSFTLNSTLVEDRILTFSWGDYIIFIMVLIVSALVGVYFGIIKKQDTVEKYLLGGKQMGFIPVSISLVASHLSGISVLGIPSDVYYYGTAYWACVASGMIVSVIVINVYLPVFYDLQVKSSFEYLELRFGRKVRYIASMMFILKAVFFIPIVVYVPAMALNQVTGINVHFITPVLCSVCVFYTTLGGLKAVVWTDTIQFMVTLVAMSTVIFLGINYVGGIEVIWDKADQGGRLDFFNMDPTPSSRCTFWGVVIGLTTLWVSQIGVYQASIQKFMSVPTFQDAKKTVIVFCIAFTVFKSIICFIGLLMYAKYQFCDPYTSKVITKHDQLLPYFVLDMASSISGLSGLFIAGIFSTALSSMSANLNTISGTFYEDFVSPFMPKDTTEQTASNIMKILTVAFGVLSIVLVLLVEQLGAILELSLAVSGITAGPILGLFTLGMCVPWANTKGSLCGGILGFGVVLWTSVGYQYHKKAKDIVFPTLPLLTTNCTLNSTKIYTFPTEYDRRPIIGDDVFFLFKLSFIYYTVFGFLLCMVFGVLFSWCTTFKNLKDLDPKLITPGLRFLVPKEKKTELLDYKTIEKALQIINKE